MRRRLIPHIGSVPPVVQPYLKVLPQVVWTDVSQPGIATVISNRDWYIDGATDPDSPEIPEDPAVTDTNFLTKDGKAIETSDGHLFNVREGSNCSDLDKG